MAHTTCLVCLITTFSLRCKKCLGWCAASSGYIAKLKQSIFFGYLWTIHFEKCKHLLEYWYYLLLWYLWRSKLSIWHLWQPKTAVFLQRFVIRNVLLWKPTHLTSGMGEPQISKWSKLPIFLWQTMTGITLTTRQVVYPINQSV
jgi:hypothetical protein